MSKKKARLFTCSNVFFNQYFNLYLHKNPIVNNNLKIKENVYYSKIQNNESNRESLQYSLIQNYPIYLNNKKNLMTINSTLNLYLKKYFNNIKFIINMDKILYKRNLVSNKIYFNTYNKYLTINNNINFFYKGTSKYYRNKNFIIYNEKQDENKLLNRKSNINRLQ